MAAPAGEPLKPAGVRILRLAAISEQWTPPGLSQADKESRIAQSLAAYSTANHVSAVLDTRFAECVNSAFDITAPILDMLRTDAGAISDRHEPDIAHIAVFDDGNLSSASETTVHKRAQAFCDSRGVDILLRKRQVALSVASVVEGEGLKTENVLDEIVDFHTSAGLFRFPYGYLAGRPPIELARKGTLWESFNIAFWMPDGRYVSKDAVIQPTGEPRDDGRTLPNSNEYMIILWKISPPNLIFNKVTPAEKLKNLIDADGTSGLIFDQEHGFLKIAPAKPNPSGDFHHYYGARYNERTRSFDNFLMRCWIDRGPTTPPLCTGDVLLGGVDLVYRVEIIRTRIEHMFDVIDTSIALLTKWRIAR